MKEYYISPIEKYKDIIVAVEDFTTITRRNRTIISGRLYFIDGTFLEIYDRWYEDKLERYNHYWLDEDTVIIGWDNKEHHKDVATFPHHKHTKQKEQVLSSNERTLEAVLNVINKYICK
ncbi:MAG: hypothetical protein GX039_07620 [Clostridia bacterium]|nr:hypothetical protein [Clostridia bacterium]